MKSILPLIILTLCLIALLALFNYQIERLGKQVEEDVTKYNNLKDSLQTEIHILQINRGRYEIFYDVMKEKHPQESQDIMDSIE